MLVSRFGFRRRTDPVLAGLLVGLWILSTVSMVGIFALPPYAIHASLQHEGTLWHEVGPGSD